MWRWVDWATKRRPVSDLLSAEKSVMDDRQTTHGRHTPDEFLCEAIHRRRKEPSMSEDMGNPSRAPRRSLRGLAVVGSLTLVATLTFVLLSMTSGTAHGSGTGGGGGCFSTTGPVCVLHSNQADADFGVVDFPACVGTDASVTAFASLSVPGRAASQMVFVSVVTFNPCTGDLIAGASNIDPATGLPQFSGVAQFGSKLTTASLSGTAPMFDLMTGAQVFTSTVNLTWQGFGSSSTFIDSSHVRAAGFTLNEYFHGVSRNAEASGTLTDGTGANAAVSPTTNADLNNATSGTVQLIHS